MILKRSFFPPDVVLRCLRAKADAFERIKILPIGRGNVAARNPFFGSQALPSWLPPPKTRVVHLQLHSYPAFGFQPSSPRNLIQGVVCAGVEPFALPASSPALVYTYAICRGMEVPVIGDTDPNKLKQVQAGSR